MSRRGTSPRSGSRSGSRSGPGLGSSRGSGAGRRSDPRTGPDSDSDTGDELVPSGEEVVPSGEEVVPSGEEVVPSGEEVVPSGDDRGDAFWEAVLRAGGLDDAAIEAARRQGPLAATAIERAIRDELPSMDLEAASERSGLAAEELRAFWRALGFPNPEPGEPAFSEEDLAVLQGVLSFVDAEVIDRDVALQMARVIGSSVARIAAASVDVADRRAAGGDLSEFDPISDEEAAREVARAAELIPILSRVMERVWRGHLATEARARLMQADATAQQVTVGFADLEGFTSLSQQLPPHELAGLVNRFEEVAYDVVAGFPGTRVVKMIGDEVMFAADDVATGAELALTLADTYAAHEALGDVRVGLATGTGLRLEGDLYGPAVNLASRIVSIAYPGSVVVPAEVLEALEGDPRFGFRTLRPHYLRHIGRVKLWVLKRAGDRYGDGEGDDGVDGDGEGRTLRRARERRAARRVWISDRMAERLADLAAETAGDVTDRAVRRIIEGKAVEPGTPAEDPAPEP